jgi:hypothetical protein
MKHLKFLEFFFQKMETNLTAMDNPSLLLEVMSEWDLSLEDAFINISNALPICPFLNDLAQRITFDLPMQMKAYLEKV